MIQAVIRHGAKPSRERDAHVRAGAISATAILAIMVLAAGCSNGGSDKQRSAPRLGGTAYLETAQEPPTLNTWLASGGMLITRTVTDPLHSPWIRIDASGHWIPVLAAKVPTRANGGVRPTSHGGFEVVLPIRPEATWSDGQPITCNDLRFTWKTVMDERWQIGSRIGWSSIRDVACPSRHEAHIEFSEPYAPYMQDILASFPLPEHALAGADFNTAWSNRISVSSGPFHFVRWNRGSELVMERVPHWWGGGRSKRPYLDRIVVRFVPDAQTMKLDLRMEDADMIGLAPDTDLPQELASIHTARYSVLPGASWEQLSFNTQSWPLNDRRVRQAVAAAIDRNVITDVVLRKQVPRLDSTLLPSQRPWYRPVFESVRPDPDRVQRLMAAAGFTRNSDDVWSQNNRPVSLTLRTTSGNPLRSKTVQLIQDQLKAAGFASHITLLRNEVFFAQYIAPGNYNLAIYAFGHGPEPTQSKIFSCSEIPKAPDYVGKNNFRYCNADVDAAARGADRELDPTRRTQLLIRMQQGVARDMPTLPLFQAPDTLAWNRRLAGVRPNPLGRNTWNTEDWWLRW